LTFGRIIGNSRHTNLLQLVQTCECPCPCASTLNCWEQKGHEHADDRDDDQQLDERKSQAATRGNGHGKVSVFSVRECAVRKSQGNYRRRVKKMPAFLNSRGKSRDLLQR